MKFSKYYPRFFQTVVLCFIMGHPTILNGQITWTENRYFPQFESPDLLYIFPVNSPVGNGSGPWQVDWRIDDSPEIMHCLTLVGMQGIINRPKPRVFLNWYDPSLHFEDHINGTWADLVRENVDMVTEMDLENAEIIDFLWDEFGSLFEGAVIYDPDVPETINLATMIAGLENRLILGPDQQSMLALPVFTDVYDLRTLVQQESWDDSFDSQISIYQWAFANLWPDLEHRIIAMHSAGPPTSGDKETNDFFFPLDIASRDLSIALKLPVFYLNPKYPEHKTLFEQMMTDAPSPIAISGVVGFNEDGIVQTASAFGNILAGYNWPGEPITSGNISVLSGIHPDIIPASDQLSPDNIIGTLGRNPIATLFDSDGDALFFQNNQGFHGYFGWEDVQGQNFAWETNPLLAEISPLAWNYYQQTKSMVSFTAGISGVGYCTPHLMSPAQFSKYLEISAGYMEETGLRVARFNGLGGPWDEFFATEYYDKLHGIGYLGTIIGFRNAAPFGTSIKYLGHPSPAVSPYYSLAPSNRDQILSDLSLRDPNNFFIEINADNFVPEITNESDPDASGGQTVLIKKEFANSPSYSLVYSTENLSLPPGEYEIKYRLKVPDNSSSQNVAQIYAGIRFDQPDGEFLESVFIQPNQFVGPNQYQDFSFTLNFDELTHDIQFRLDYGELTTDVYADYIQVTNLNPISLPVFAPLYMSLAVDPSEFDGMIRLASEFESAFNQLGGIVITTDEFIAAQNPEYMIEFAGSLVDPAHPLLQEAAQLLNVGNFFSSLLKAREAITGLAREMVVVPNLSEIEEEESGTIEILLNGVADLGSFIFELEYDPAIIQVNNVSNGSFLQSTGRTANEVNNIIESTNGLVVLEATTTGDNPGASGAGQIATISFTALSVGNTNLSLKNVIVKNVAEDELNLLSLGAGEISVTEKTEEPVTGIDHVYPTMGVLLDQNFPNPVVSETEIGFQLAKSANVKIELIDAIGRPVLTLVDKNLPSGAHNVIFRKNNLMAGIYFYVITTGKHREVKRMLLLD